MSVYQKIMQLLRGDSIQPERTVPIDLAEQRQEVVARKLSHPQMDSVAQAQEARRTLGLSLAIAQEMNNPLSVLSANQQYLALLLQDKAEFGEVLQENQAQLARLTDLVTSLLDMMHLRNEEAWIDISLANLLSTVEVMLEPLLKQLSFSENQWVELINTVPKQGLPRVSVEPHLIKNLLVELITALIPTFEQVQHPSIHLSAEFVEESGQVSLSILSNGCQVDEALLQALAKQAQVTLRFDVLPTAECCIRLALPVSAGVNAHLAIVDTPCMAGFVRMIGGQLPSLLRNLQDELVVLIGNMQAGVARQEWREVCSHVHSIKGLSRSVCAHRLAQSAVELEFMLKQDRIDSKVFAKQFEDFIEVIEMTSNAFNAYLSEDEAVTS
jgi:HPt (histidine-containing phosphotransfer) domain-containing protein